MAETVIYVSGNPKLYPIEYYDKGEKAYDGVIPRMLADFEEKTAYHIEYYKADGKDRREQHFKNSQADVISGVGYDYQPDGETITVFQAVVDGETVSFGLTFTEAATEEFKASLREYVEGFSQEKKTGLLIGSVQREREARPVNGAALGAAFLLAALAGILAWLVLRYRRRAQRTERRLETDEVTGLGNRDYLERYYRQFIEDRNRVMYHACYFYVDVERLRRLAGRKEGEEAMRYAGLTLLEAAGDTDILARISEDGFLLMKLTGKGRGGGWIPPLLEKIRAYSGRFQKPYEIHAWAGVYPLKQTDRNLDDIIMNARQIAYTACRENVDYKFCSDTMLRRFLEKRSIETGLGRAFTNNEFQMYLQFYVDGKTEQITGAEALTRWNHPTKGLIPPGLFIPVLERTGEISRLDYLMLEKVCAFLERNFGAAGEGFFLSCNFSRRSFTALDFVENCKRIIDKYQFNRSLLTFELTESPAPEDMVLIRKNAEEIKKHGVNLALDDFGSGYTSFRDLLVYPVDIVKLDKSITDGVVTEKGRGLLKALITAGHELSVKCLAEGVETDEVLEALRELSCDAIQGYRFYYPLPELEAEAILKDGENKDL